MLTWVKEWTQFGWFLEFNPEINSYIFSAIFYLAPSSTFCQWDFFYYDEPQVDYSRKAKTAKTTVKVKWEKSRKFWKIIQATGQVVFPFPEFGIIDQKTLFRWVRKLIKCGWF